MGKLKLYRINMKYIRNLQKIDRRVPDVSPQNHKQTRPFLGIIVLVNKRKYCIPLSSQKDIFAKENMTLRKIKDKDGEVISILNINNMIPVREEYIYELDLKTNKNDSMKIKKNKNFYRKELHWCRKNINIIEQCANILYSKYISGEDFNKKSICLDFPALERECDKGKKLDKKETSRPQQ